MLPAHTHTHTHARSIDRERAQPIDRWRARANCTALTHNINKCTHRHTHTRSCAHKIRSSGCPRKNVAAVRSALAAQSIGARRSARHQIRLINASASNQTTEYRHNGAAADSAAAVADAASIKSAIKERMHLLARKSLSVVRARAKTALRGRDMIAKVYAIKVSPGTQLYGWGELGDC